MRGFGFTMRARMEALRVYGAALAPMSAWQILQGVETLHVAHGAPLCGTRWKVAEFLRRHPRVGWVKYPGLEDGSPARAGGASDAHGRRSARCLGPARVRRGAADSPAA